MKKFIWLILLIPSISYAQINDVKDLIIKFPTDVISDENKIGYLYKAQEELRLLHNQKGDDFRNGIITKDEWETFLKNVFNPRQEALSVEIIKAKQFLSADTKYSVDLEKNFEEKNP